MRHLDFSPLYRSNVGFDHLFTLLDSLGHREGPQSYPPYDIERTGESSYCISMAVAGFSAADVSIETHRNSLSIIGERESGAEGTEVLYRGLASRRFTRHFQLADHVEVVGATLEKGLLSINLRRNIPEEMKPRKISISASSGSEGSSNVKCISAKEKA